MVGGLVGWRVYHSWKRGACGVMLLYIHILDLCLSRQCADGLGLASGKVLRLRGCGVVVRGLVWTCRWRILDLWLA